MDCVLGTIEARQRFITICESPYHRPNFCQGTVSEMLERRDDFCETFSDDGGIDMAQALGVYREVAGYAHRVLPDPMPPGGRQALAFFSCGYLRARLQTAGAKLKPACEAGGQDRMVDYGANEQQDATFEPQAAEGRDGQHPRGTCFKAALARGWQEPCSGSVPVMSTKYMRIKRLCGVVCLFLLALSIFGAVYEVGPGKPLAEPGQVPWESLNAGDTVLIYWRTNAYQAKWVLCRQGTAEAPITVRGVPGPAGDLPVIDGNCATTRPALNYWNRPRGVIKIGGANVPADTTPSYITIENLEIKSARPPYTFLAANGASTAYPNNAAALYVEKGDHLTIRHCAFHDCGNGLFVAYEAREVLVEGNAIYDNGNVGSIYEHNSYTAAAGITFQYNRYGPLRPGCGGNNLKDRSAGLVVRYNWIEGGNRQLDLVDGEVDPSIFNHPLYHQTFVCGNVLIEPAGEGNRQIVHYGGDSGNTATYRKGTLYFNHNTLVSNRTDRTTLFRLSTNDESCDCRNNLIYVSAPGSTLSLLDDTGRLNLTHNWLKAGWVRSFGGTSGTITNGGSNLTGNAPGFLHEASQNFHLAANSPCIDAGAAAPPRPAASQ